MRKLNLLLFATAAVLMTAMTAFAQAPGRRITPPTVRRDLRLSPRALALPSRWLVALLVNRASARQLAKARRVIRERRPRFRP